MLRPECLECVKLETIDIEFESKPIIVGGMAMEYYGLRKHGDDIDFIVSDQDYLALEARYRTCRKDMWGDFGVRIKEYELFRSIWKFDYSYFNEYSLDIGDFKIIAIDMLFRMKVFAMDYGEKHKNDVLLIKKYFERRQRKEYVDYMNRNVERYLNAPNGLILNGDYY